MKKRVLATTGVRTGLLEGINQNNSLLIIAFCFLLGLLAGVLYFKLQNADGDFYAKEFDQLYTDLSGGFGQIFFSALLRQLPFAAAVFLAGTCMVGAVLVPAVTALNGASCGIVMGYAYASHGLMGIVFNLLILIPPAIITAMALILSARESLGFSLSLARLALPGLGKPAIEQDFKLYCLRQLFVLLFFVAAALVQTVMALSFLSFFAF